MDTEESAPPTVRLVGLIAGPLGAVLATTMAYGSLSHDAALVVGLVTWMTVWWLTIAVDLAVTALLPVLLLPFLGISTFSQAAAPYASDVIFLFGSGFVLATALERYGLSTRFAAVMLRLAGTRASAVVAALMVTTAIISAFVSNTATAAAMLPVALAIARAAKDVSDEGRQRLAAAATLGVAYGASIGGAFTLIGSPPNAIAARYVEGETQTALSFVGWLGYGLPIGLILLPIAWFVLVRLVFPIRGVRLMHAVASVSRDRDAISQRGQYRVLAIFSATVLGWLSRPIWGGYVPAVSDAGIAIAGAVLLMTVPRSLSPYRPLLVWRELVGIPWGVLILFGGGLSLAAAIDSTGVAAALANALSPIAGWPIIAIILAIVAIACFGSELASNTALAATAMPLIGAIAKSTGAPLAPLAVAAALGASLAFMLPVGTPPNAMAFATGHVRSGDMMKAGLILNLASIVVITLVVVMRIAIGARLGI
ncbi:MAG: DASS family sodium-coupled anion symporter [Phycisphaerae bacterium]|mgnify:CR=1 FL=1|nr:DASS family sodium-coupled anion symporter [Phycisphaerae bacterium]